MKRFLIAALLLVAACSDAKIDRETWLRMSDSEKTLAVESLRGHQVAVEQKGGPDALRHSRPTPEYVAEIDRAYAGGAEGSVDEIWRSLADTSAEGTQR